MFSWTGKNKCPSGSECGKFTDVFGNSVDFCENLWGGSFRVASDVAEDCVKIDFSGSNPNYKVARKRAEEVASSAVTFDTLSVLTAVSFSMNVAFVMFH